MLKIAVEKERKSKMKKLFLMIFLIILTLSTITFADVVTPDMYKMDIAGLKLSSFHVWL